MVRHIESHPLLEPLIITLHQIEAVYIYYIQKQCHYWSLAFSQGLSFGSFVGFLRFLRKVFFFRLSTFVLLEMLRILVVYRLA